MNLIATMLGAFSVVAGGACSSQPDARPRETSTSVESPEILIQPSDIEAYRSGVAREIGLRIEAERQGFVTREAMVDSAAAEAAGLPVPRYRLVVGGIEDLLARGPQRQGDSSPHLAPGVEPVWQQERLALDSIRLEAVVLRARTGS
ncbi:MAG: hypothetical protein ABI836_10465 [Gemmatimonadota bacterium]